MLEDTRIQDRVSAEERRLRAELADFYHVVDYLGWTELIFNHISVRLPGPQHHYLVNPFGLHYNEVTPDNLVKVSVTGELVEPSRYPANPAGFSLHGAIHEHRPDIACIAHTHTTAVSAVAMKRGGFDHNSFYGAQLAGRVGYHDFEGITLYPEERVRLLASLGDKSVLLLRNHGVAVCERDIPSTFLLLWVVQRAAEIQCAAAALPGASCELSPEVLARCHTSAADLGAQVQMARVTFDAVVRRMKSARR